MKLNEIWYQKLKGTWNLKPNEINIRDNYIFYNPKNMEIIYEEKTEKFIFLHQYRFGASATETYYSNGYFGIITKEKAEVEEFQNHLKTNKTFFIDLMNKYHIDFIFFKIEWIVEEKNKEE